MSRKTFYENNANLFPRVEHKLELFIELVSRGEPPPNWLMGYMAVGAEEFLAGGKPWKIGKTGRRSKRSGEEELKCYVLNKLAGLSVNETVEFMGRLDMEGKDTSRTMRRDIGRGEGVYKLMLNGQSEAIKAVISCVLEAPAGPLSPARKAKANVALIAHIAYLDSLEVEPIYE